MKKMGKKLALLGPLVLLAGLQSAQASSSPWEGVGGIGGVLCRILGGPFCGAQPPSHDPPHEHPGDPKPVPEPEMLGLFALGTISSAVAVYRRRRK